MQTADNVAKWFLQNNQAGVLSGDADYITNLKLQKLLYYAQGMNLALNDECLFADPIVAWSYGPVVESVYDTYKVNGSDSIKVFEPPADNFTDAEEDALYLTQDAFGQYSAWKLSEMTHTEAPWQNTARNQIISVNTIREYFKAHYLESGEYPMTSEMRATLADCRAGRNLIGAFDTPESLFKSLGI